MVGYTRHQWCLGADDKHIDMVIHDEAFHFGEILGVKLDIDTYLGSACIARGNK